MQIYTTHKKSICCTVTTNRCETKHYYSLQNVYRQLNTQIKKSKFKFSFYFIIYSTKVPSIKQHIKNTTKNISYTTNYGLLQQLYINAFKFLRFNFFASRDQLQQLFSVSRETQSIALTRRHGLIQTG